MGQDYGHERDCKLGDGPVLLATLDSVQGLSCVILSEFYAHRSGQGNIVFISSIAGFTPLEGLGM